MKKLKILITLIVSLVAFSPHVFAASGNLTVSSTNVHVGDKFTVNVRVNSSAAWNVHVSTSGPVSGCTIDQADATSDAMDANKTFSATCTATGEGTIKIVLSGDVTSAADGNAVNVSDSKTVNVSKKPASSSNNNNNTNDNKSKNNNLKELSVDGYELVKVDANNYTLSVPNDVTSINVKATAEDTKAKISGIGEHEIKLGENNIEIVVTAENGANNKINIKVIRKDDYYLDDLETLLKNNKTDDINITIKSDTIVTSQDLVKIKNSGKIVKLNYYTDDKTLLYTWVIDGSKLVETNQLSTEVSKDSSNKKNILVQANYADGIFLELKQNLPFGTKIRMYFADKYSNNDLVNIYTYDNKTSNLKMVTKELKVENGYVELDSHDYSNYFMTMATLDSAKKPAINIFMIISIIEFILLILVCCIKFKGKKTYY